ncbi:hypothetical protein GCM10009601_57000 [Streptomyces thermospinosisporus]|uniref:Transposase n=1 Tax=Streptomyces thermospinosisporus TaxID=161482 RepID=A0ABP4JWV1_9ACTN
MTPSRDAVDGGRSRREPFTARSGASPSEGRHATHGARRVAKDRANIGRSASLQIDSSGNKTSKTGSSGRFGIVRAGSRASGPTPVAVLAHGPENHVPTHNPPGAGTSQPGFGALPPGRRARLLHVRSRTGVCLEGGSPRT